MHKFLRSIGFSSYHKRKEIEEMLVAIQKNAVSKKVVQMDPETALCEIRTELAPGMGIVQVGAMNEEDEFERDYYYPYLLSKDMTSDADCSVQRHTENETYAGLIDENRVGMSLIFFVENSLDYKERSLNKKVRRVRSANLTGMAVEGKILLPIQKTQKKTDIRKTSARDRNQLLEAAKNGDQDALETLTIEDIDLYSQISRRVQKEDIYSIVESTFMPSGIECDQYAILGEIFRVEEKINSITNEKVYDLTVECNEMIFHICIAAKDLLGEPAPGRRFKGAVWMQGTIKFVDEN